MTDLEKTLQDRLKKDQEEQLSLLGKLTNPEPDVIRGQLMKYGTEAVLRSVEGNSKLHDLVNVHADFMDTEPRDGYYHSALCAMSLPIRKPKDEYAPIVRKDGKLSLMIQPTKIIGSDGNPEQVGVPYGSVARLVLMHVISQAIKNESRIVYAGKSMRQFMTRLGYRSVGGGPRGTLTLFKDQLKRLNACQWTMRFGYDETSDVMKDFKLIDNQLLRDEDGSGSHAEVIHLSERFFEHTLSHRVGFDERALAALKSDPTALDLYTYLVWRLPKIKSGERVHIGWGQLQNHLGNAISNVRYFRKAIIDDKMPRVLAVYPGAKVEMCTKGLTLYHAPSPVAYNPKLFAVTDRRTGT